MGPGCLAKALHVSSPVCGSPNSLLIIPLWGKCYDHVCACARALPCAHVGGYMSIHVCRGQRPPSDSVLQVPPTLFSLEEGSGLSSLHRQGWLCREPQVPLLCLRCTGLHMVAFFFWRLTLGPWALYGKGFRNGAISLTSGVLFGGPFSSEAN